MFSTFFEKPFVSRVNRLLLIRRVRFWRSMLPVEICMVRVRVAGDDGSLQVDHLRRAVAARPGGLGFVEFYRLCDLV
jgi:hypothetical protein